MNQIRKNTVNALGQLRSGDSVVFYNPEGSGKRVLFVGNSITMHGYKPEIGWYGENYGMAASSKEKDYVHLVMDRVRAFDRDAAFCIAQMSEWEANYGNGKEIIKSKYQNAIDFCADTVIMRVAENCPVKDFDGDVFCEQYEYLIDSLKTKQRCNIILTTSFWRHPADECIFAIGKKHNYSVIHLGDLGEDDEMKAIGLFEHSGVSNHPGDLGMAEIAKRILSKMELNK